jgi:hypothetical protein
MRFTLYVFAVLTWSRASSADTIKIWPNDGRFAPTHEHHCGIHVREELTDFVGKLPLVVVKDDPAGDGAFVSIIVENYAAKHVAKRADRVLAGVRCKDGSTRTYGFWDEGPRTFVATVTMRGVKRPVALSIIKNKDSTPCYEKWFGFGEVQ